MSYKVLHIPFWYPSEDDPYKASWIKNHIVSLDKFCVNFIYHVEVRTNRKWALRHRKISNTERELIIDIKETKWFIIEILATILLIYVLFFVRKINKYDVINFHIAYPICTYLHILQRMIKIPVIITEHWSAYHYNFGVSNYNKLRRIKRIFHGDVNLITVSNSLAEDIRKFSDNFALKPVVIPNIVDENIFMCINHRVKSTRFFMVGEWKWPKDPFTVIKAFKNLIIDYPDARLRIGGFGPQEKDIKRLIDNLKLYNYINYLGSLQKEEVAAEMNYAMAYIHSSNYETFSVVCAEALCCGTPVISSNVGGIKEFVNKNNGYLVEKSSDEKHWKKVITYFIEHRNLYDRKAIARDARNKFSSHFVGKEYYKVIRDLLKPSYV